jgi:hypothetical protein
MQDKDGDCWVRVMGERGGKERIFLTDDLPCNDVVRGSGKGNASQLMAINGWTPQELLKHTNYNRIGNKRN